MVNELKFEKVQENTREHTSERGENLSFLRVRIVSGVHESYTNFVLDKQSFDTEKSFWSQNTEIRDCDHKYFDKPVSDHC